MPWRSGCIRCGLATHCVAVLAFVLTACVAADRAPDAEVTKTYRRILVVPMESPLFTLSSAVSEDFRTILGYTAIGNIFGLVAGIIVVAAEGDNVDKDARYAEYEAALGMQTWNPPVILARISHREGVVHNPRPKSAGSRFRPLWLASGVRLRPLRRRSSRIASLMACWLSVCESGRHGVGSRARPRPPRVVDRGCGRAVWRGLRGRRPERESCAGRRAAVPVRDDRPADG